METVKVRRQVYIPDRTILISVDFHLLVYVSLFREIKKGEGKMSFGDDSNVMKLKNVKNQ